MRIYPEFCTWNTECPVCKHRSVLTDLLFPCSSLCWLSGLWCSSKDLGAFVDFPSAPVCAGQCKFCPFADPAQICAWGPAYDRLCAAFPFVLVFAHPCAFSASFCVFCVSPLLSWFLCERLSLSTISLAIRPLSVFVRPSV